MRIELEGRQPLLRRDAVTDPYADEGWLVIDARSLRFAAPIDLAGIAALSNAAAADGLKVALVTPEDADVAYYLERMDVFRMLPDSAVSQPPTPAGPRFDRTSALVEVSPLNFGNAEEVANRIGLILTGHHNKAWAEAVFSAVGELIDNAVSHGASPVGAFIVAQRYTGRTTGEARFEVAICDTGIGIAEHLRSNPHNVAVETAPEALELALRPGITGTTSRHRGNGLADVQRITAGGGRLILRSGEAIASVAIRALGTDPAEARGDDRIMRSAANVSGTWANLRARFP